MNTKRKTTNGAVHIGFAMIGGIIVMHIVGVGVIWLFSIKPKIEVPGQTLPAVATITPPPTHPIAVVFPEIVPATATKRDIMLDIEPGPGSVTVHIPGMCEVDYSRDLQQWNYLGTYFEPAKETFGCTEESVWFRARPVRP